MQHMCANPSRSTPTNAVCMVALVNQRIIEFLERHKSCVPKTGARGRTVPICELVPGGLFVNSRANHNPLVEATSSR
jgi:hypothetical protein